MRLVDFLWACLVRIVDYGSPPTDLDQVTFGPSDNSFSLDIFPGIEHSISDEAVISYEKSAACYNSPKHRRCWDGEYNIWTDYEELEEVPKTGVVNKVSVRLLS